MGLFITLHNNVHLFLISRNSAPIVCRTGVSNVSLSMKPNRDLFGIQKSRSPHYTGGSDIKLSKEDEEGIEANEGRNEF